MLFHHQRKNGMDSRLAQLTSWQVDPEDVIVHVDEGFRLFARENDAPDLAHAPLGRPLWEFIHGEQTQHIYRQLLTQSRRQNRVIQLPYRCDSPGLVRELSMTLAPLADGGVCFTSRTVQLQPRSPLPVLDRAAQRSDEMIRMCSVCKCVAVDDNWLELETAVAARGLLLADLPPAITHSLCPRCEKTLTDQANEAFPGP